MPRNFFVTGMPKAGKTTILHQLIRELKKSKLRVGGFISPEEKHHGTRTAFHVMDIDSGREAILADIHGDGPKVSKYHVNIRSFERVVLPSMKKCRRYDVFIIDEIGRMEMKSRKFSEALDGVLDAEIPLIASLSKDYVGKFGALGEVLRVSPANRQAVYLKLLTESKGLKAKKMPQPKKKKEVRKVKKKAKKAPKKKAPPKKKAVKKKPAKKAKKKEKAEKVPEKKPEKATEEKPKKAPKAKPEKAPAEKPKVHLEEEEEHEEKGFLGKVKNLFGV